MSDNYKKAGLVFAVSIFIQVVYHLALHVQGDGILISAFVYIGRMGWITVDLLLCLAGFFCYSIFSPKSSGKKEWLSGLLAFLKFAVPSYYLFLLLYLTFGVRLQNQLGNAFALNEGYTPSLLLFYANFLLAKGPLSGVALESIFLICMMTQLFFGLGFVFATIKSRKTAPVLITILWIAAIALRLAYEGRNRWFTFFNTFTRTDSFLTGILLGYLYSLEPAKQWLYRKRKLLLALGAILLLAIAAITKGLSRWYDMIDTVSNPAIAVFMFAFVNRLFSGGTSPAPGASSGIISVSFVVYLVKHPIIYMIEAILFQKMGMPRSLLVNAVFIIGSIAACYLFGLAWNATVGGCERLLLWKNRARSWPQARGDALFDDAP